MLSDSGPTGSSGSFDISDVDLTNFPELDCGLNSRLVVGSDSCQMSRRHPSWALQGGMVRVRLTPNPPKEGVGSAS